MSQRHLHRMPQRQRYVERLPAAAPLRISGREINPRQGYSIESDPQREQSFEDCNLERCTMSYFVNAGTTYNIGNYESAVLPEIHIEGTVSVTGTGILSLTG